MRRDGLMRIAIIAAASAATGWLIGRDWPSPLTDPHRPEPVRTAAIESNRVTIFATRTNTSKVTTALARDTADLRRLCAPLVGHRTHARPRL
jgi:hypothetical protein